jgi:hypothetical protein
MATQVFRSKRLVYHRKMAKKKVVVSAAKLSRIEELQKEIAQAYIQGDSRAHLVASLELAKLTAKSR